MKYVEQIKKAINQVKGGTPIELAIKDLPEVYQDMVQYKDATVPKQIPQYQKEDDKVIQARIANHFCKLVELSVNTKTFQSFSTGENKLDGSGRIRTTLQDRAQARYINVTAKRDEIKRLEKNLFRLS